jgi:hypothetical protein
VSTCSPCYNSCDSVTDRKLQSLSATNRTYCLRGRQCINAGSAEKGIAEQSSAEVLTWGLEAGSAVALLGLCCRRMQNRLPAVPDIAASYVSMFDRYHVGLASAALVAAGQVVRT